MKHLRLLPALGLSLALAPLAGGHDPGNSDTPHPHYDWSVKPPEVVRAPEWFLAQASPPHAARTNTPAPGAGASMPTMAKPFVAFSDKLKLRWDERFLYIEGNGLPAHNMMVGITAWQQQVPLPQNYTGTNAWQIPLAPVPAKEPVSIKNRFLRGAIALAANGVPIFNPQNNRGEISQEIGELDEWGGHCGRADDYHYHAAPLHLQGIVGKGMPIAYALDGYPIYGLTEPDGTAPAGLDAFNGHTTAALGYHYHGSTKYPYVNGGFHGEVVERDGQVDPQPRANPVREALQALRGAKITGFESTGASSYKLTYEVNGERRAVLYAINADGTFPFEFQNGREGTTKQVYTLRERGGGGPRPEGGRPQRGPGGGGDRPPRPGGGPGGPPPREGGGNRRGGPQADRRPNEGGAQEAASPFGPDALKKPSASFVLTSPEVKDGGALPIDYTGDGSGATLPLTWRGAPAGTQSYTLVMDHLAPGNQMKSYWTMWDIPTSVTSLAKNAQGVGKVGTSFRGQLGYEPPHSQGPGAKTYVLTVYALSSPLQITQSPREVNRDILLAAMKDKVLASASMSVVYTRSGSASNEDQRPPRREEANNQPPPPQAQAQQPPAPVAQGQERRGGPGGGKGKGGPPGLIKPSIADTMKLNVYADNWFMLYVNGRLVAVDPIQFTPHNVVSVDFLPEYPMTIAVMAKDNADPKTGMEYGTSIGDGGFILKFGDGTVTNATWKAKSFFRGPLGGDTANPKVEHTPIPDQWWAVDFDDSKWVNATEYTEERINPKQPYFEADFKGAKFIWTADIDLDNTILFRTKIEKPDWKQRWSTKPDLDVTGAPFK